jgi:poly(A) polymerase
LEKHPILRLLKKCLGIKHKSLKNISLQKVSAAHYQISSTDFSAAAVEVVLQLQNAGHEAYIVGGGVRDLLLGTIPKDFDVATSAKPEEVKRLFRRCFIVGRRFRLAHVHLKNEVIEVATFRAEHETGSTLHGKTKGGMIVRDNIYGNLEEDAIRRDFTLNALYYNPADNSILDYTGGLVDLKQGQLRMIGEPKQRYREDPVRILRALRLSGKLNLEIETETAAPISKMASLLTKVPSARLADELVKFFMNRNAWACFQTLEQYHLLGQLLPATAKAIQSDETAKTLIQLTLENTATRLTAEKTVNFNFMMAAFLWGPLRSQARKLLQQKMPARIAFDQAIQDILRAQSESILITRKLGEMIRDIWRLQGLLENPRSRTVHTTLEKKEFRAAYDFLLLREKAGEPLKQVASWWTELIAADEPGRHALVEGLAATQKKPATHRRTRRTKPPAAPSA